MGGLISIGIGIVIIAYILAIYYLVFWQDDDFPDDFNLK